MSAPDELRQLADQLPRISVATGCIDDVCDHEECADLRAAAVALRHYANLLDAIGDPDGILAGCDASASLWAFHRLRRIANAVDAAAVSPPPAPTTCPTCGWIDGPHDDAELDAFTANPCPDSWHQETT